MNQVIALPRSATARPSTDSPAAASGGLAAGQLSAQEIELLMQLRREADHEKDSFGQHAFQALSISSVALGGILYLMFSPGGFPALGLASLAILVFALMTCRMGSSSYSGANRAYGFELYLYRIRTIYPEAEGRWLSEYRSIEWEAAMRAWRVVQATLYEEIYDTRLFLVSDRCRRKYAPGRRPIWFSQKSLSKESGATWHAGSYLSRVHIILFLVALASVAILFVTIPAVLFHPLAETKELKSAIGDINGYFAAPSNAPVVSVSLINFLQLFGCIVAFIVGSALLVVRWYAEANKREIMEDGLLSIHACAIVWQAVVVAHFNALRRARECAMTSWDLADFARRARLRNWRDCRQWKKGAISFEQLLARRKDVPRREIDGAGLAGYTFWLGEEAASLKRCADNVPGWVGEGEEAVHKKRNKRWS